ncbi:hypothetical protein HK099_008504 [Clydaea vesicula]|uniref:Pentatricopeptide repeat-containing protein n=1 Tax=Clydaea vesicula TaxID=447962 RepID=A0AAD5XXR4_9FUNG|nr:hypothetical protein HK099_008504 [Clydaea vesicula]
MSYPFFPNRYLFLLPKRQQCKCTFQVCSYSTQPRNEHIFAVLDNVFNEGKVKKTFLKSVNFNVSEKYVPKTLSSDSNFTSWLKIASDKNVNEILKFAKIALEDKWDLRDNHFDDLIHQLLGKNQVSCAYSVALLILNYGHPNDEEYLLFTTIQEVYNSLVNLHMIKEALILLRYLSASKYFKIAKQSFETIITHHATILINFLRCENLPSHDVRALKEKEIPKLDKKELETTLETLILDAIKLNLPLNDRAWSLCFKLAFQKGDLVEIQKIKRCFELSNSVTGNNSDIFIFFPMMITAISIFSSRIPTSHQDAIEKEKIAFAMKNMTLEWLSEEKEAKQRNFPPSLEEYMFFETALNLDNHSVRHHMNTLEILQKKYPMQNLKKQLSAFCQSENVVKAVEVYNEITSKFSSPFHENEAVEHLKVKKTDNLQDNHISKILKPFLKRQHQLIETDFLLKRFCLLLNNHEKYKELMLETLSLWRDNIKVKDTDRVKAFYDTVYFLWGSAVLSSNLENFVAILNATIVNGETKSVFSYYFVDVSTIKKSITSLVAYQDDYFFSHKAFIHLIKCGIFPSNSELLHLIRTLAINGQDDLILDVSFALISCGFIPAPQIQSYFVKALTVGGKPIEALSFLSQINSVDMKPSSFEIENIALSIAEKDGLKEFNLNIENLSGLDVGKDEAVRWKLDVKFLSKLLLCSRNIEDVEMVLELADNSPIKKDIHWLNTLILVLCRIKKPEMAEIRAKELISCGIKPNILTYNLLIKGWGRVGLYYRAMRWFNWLRDDVKNRKLPNFNADVHTYESLIYAIMKCPEFDTKKKKEMIRAVLKQTVMTTFSVNTFIQLAIAESDYAGAQQVIQEAAKSNVFPDTVSYLHLIKGAVKSKRLIEVSLLYDELRNGLFNGSIKPDNKRFNPRLQKKAEFAKDIALSTYCSQGTLKEIYFLYTKIYADFGNLKKVESIIDEFRIKENIGPTIRITGNLVVAKFKKLGMENAIRFIQHYAGGATSSKQLSKHSYLWGVLMEELFKRKLFKECLGIPKYVDGLYIDGTMLAIMMKCCLHGKFYNIADEIFYWSLHLNKSNKSATIMEQEEKKMDLVLTKRTPPLNIFSGVEDTLATFCTFYLDCKGFNGKLEEIHEAFNTISSLNVLGRSKVKFSSGFAESKSVSGGKNRWPPETVYSSYIEALIRSNNVESALEIFRNLRHDIHDPVSVAVKPSEKMISNILHLLNVQHYKKYQLLFIQAVDKYFPSMSWAVNKFPSKD